jgi:hypothetical protein
MLSCIVGSQGGDWETKSSANFGNGQNKTLYVHIHLPTIVRVMNKVAQIYRLWGLDLKKNILMFQESLHHCPFLPLYIYTCIEINCSLC